MLIAKSHPRYISLETRSLLEVGVRQGITSLNGLIAHGRGEAFDYLLGEKTHDFANHAIDAAATMLILAKHPVISVNGNTAALVPDELISLSIILNAPLEVNLFHSSPKRLKKIEKHLFNHGVKTVLLPVKTCIIPFLDSQRKYVNPEGIYKADVVFVPLEDGDRAEALVKNGKNVITIDLNPLSRTARMATITIVDNIVRAMPLLIAAIRREKQAGKVALEKRGRDYDNEKILRQAKLQINKNLS